MYNTILYVFLVMVFFYAALFYMTYRRRRRLLEVMEHLDLDQEARKADVYKHQLLDTDLDFIKQQMKDQPVDAVTTVYTDPPDTLAEVPQYLVLSGDVLHFIHRDKDGSMRSHLIFDKAHIQQGHLEEQKLNRKEKDRLRFGRFEPKQYTLQLPVRNTALHLDIYNTLVFDQERESLNTMSMQKHIENIVVANQFLYQLGLKYPQFSVPVSIPFAY